MKKVLLALALSSLSGLASASFVPTDYDSEFAGYVVSAAELFSIKDSDGSDDDILASLYLENAGLSATNSFGIYQAGNKDNKLALFTGADSVGKSRAAQWSDADTVSTKYGSANGINLNSFGFYLNNGSETFYSEKALNSDGLDHMLAFYVEHLLLGPDYIVSFEDLSGLGDQDFDDMVVGVHDVKAVPLPAAVWMFGSALMGFLGLSRRKI